MPIRRQGSTGGMGGDHPESGGSIHLASAFVSILPETSRLAPGVKRAATAAGQNLESAISGSMATAFKKSEVYADGFAAKMASSNLGVMRGINAVVDSTRTLSDAESAHNKLLLNRKANTDQVLASQNTLDRATRQHALNIEALGTKLAGWNTAQTKFAQQEEETARKTEDRLARQEQLAVGRANRETDRQRRTFVNNLNAAKRYTDGQAAFSRKLQDSVTKLNEPPSLNKMANTFAAGQRQMRNDLAYTAQFGETHWQRMHASMALQNTMGANSLRSSMASAMDDVVGRANRAGANVKRGLLGGLGASAAVAGTAGAGMAGGLMVSAGIDRVLSGGLRRIETIQNAQIAMNAVLGNQQQATEIVNKTVQLAQGTPYGADVFLNMARNMVTMGVQTRQVTPAIEAFADAAAIMGRPASSLDQLSREVGKIQAEGRIMGRDVVELQRVGGINARSIIASHMNIKPEELTQLMSKKGGLQVDPTTIIDWLTEGILQGSHGTGGDTPAYKGGLQKMRGTISGAIEVLKSQTDRVGAALLGGADVNHPSGIMAMISRTLDPVTGSMTKWANPGGPLDNFQKRVGQSLGHMFDKLKTPSAQAFFRTLESDLTSIWHTTQTIMPVFGRLAGTLAQGFGGTALAGLTVFKDALNVLAPLIRGVTGFFADNKIITEGLIGIWATLAIRAKAMGVATRIAGSVMGAFNRTVMDTATGAVRQESMWNRMGTAYRNASRDTEGLSGKMRGGLRGAMVGVSEVGGGLMGMFGGPWGLALTAAGVGLTYLATKHDAARAAAEAQREAEKALTDEFANQLDATTALITEQARADSAKRLQESGAIGKAQSLGLDPHDLMLAVTGNQEAEARVRAGLETASKNGADPAAIAAVNSILTEQINLYQKATDQQQAYNQMLHGSWDLTQQGTQFVKDLGAAVIAVPTDKDIVVSAKTDDAKANVNALKDQGFTVAQDLNDPNLFHITANTDDAIQKFQAFVQQVQGAHPVVHIDGDMDSARSKVTALEDSLSKNPIPLHFSPYFDDQLKLLLNMANQPGQTPPGAGQVPGLGPAPVIPLPPPPGAPGGPKGPSTPFGGWDTDGHATGGRLDRSGRVHGPGTGTSDSIWGMVDGVRPIKVSHLESINTAESTKKNWKYIDAANKGADLSKILGFAQGGWFTGKHSIDDPDNKHPAIMDPVSPWTGLPMFGEDDDLTPRGYDQGGRFPGPKKPRPAGGFDPSMLLPGATPPGAPYSRSPLLGPIVQADPGVGARQKATVDSAQATLTSQQRLQDQVARGAYTGGAGSGLGLGSAQGVFDARKNLTDQTRLLTDINTALGEQGQHTQAVPRLPANAHVQSFAPTGSVWDRAFDALSGGSLGLIPNVPKDARTLTNWSQASGSDRWTAGLDLASLIPIPGMGLIERGATRGLQAAGSVGRGLIGRVGADKLGDLAALGYWRMGDKVTNWAQTSLDLHSAAAEHSLLGASSDGYSALSRSSATLSATPAHVPLHRVMQDGGTYSFPGTSITKTFNPPGVGRIWDETEGWINPLPSALSGPTPDQLNRLYSSAGLQSDLRTLKERVAKPLPRRDNAGFNDAFNDAWQSTRGFPLAKEHVREGAADALKHGYAGLTDSTARDFARTIENWYRQLGSVATSPQFKGMPYADAVDQITTPDVRNALYAMGHEVASRTIHGAPSKNPMWRGMQLDPKYLASLDRGQVMNLPVSSFARSRDAAMGFATTREPWQGAIPDEWKSAILRVAPGAHASDISEGGYEELLSSGSFGVEDILPGNGGPIEIWLKQLGLLGGQRLGSYNPGFGYAHGGLLGDSEFDPYEWHQDNYGHPIYPIAFGQPSANCDGGKYAHGGMLLASGNKIHNFLGHTSINKFSGGGKANDGGDNIWHTLGGLGSSLIDDVGAVGLRTWAAMGLGASRFGRFLGGASKFLGPAGLVAPFALDVVDPVAHTSPGDTTPFNPGNRRYAGGGLPAGLVDINGGEGGRYGPDGSAAPGGHWRIPYQDEMAPPGPYPRTPVPYFKIPQQWGPHSPFWNMFPETKQGSGSGQGPPGGFWNPSIGSAPLPGPRPGGGIPPEHSGDIPDHFSGGGRFPAGYVPPEWGKRNYYGTNVGPSPSPLYPGPLRPNDQPGVRMPFMQVPDWWHVDVLNEDDIPWWDNPPGFVPPGGIHIGGKPVGNKGDGDKRRRHRSRYHHYSSGGDLRKIRGRGTGTSDQIPGLVDGIRPIRVSHGESINTAHATGQYWPLFKQLNRGQQLSPGMLRKLGIPGFDGGAGPNDLLAADNPSTADPRHGGIPGMSSGQGEDIVEWLREVVDQYNSAMGTSLKISADFPGGPTGHPDDGGQHSEGHAVDIAGSSDQMAQFANYWASNPNLVAITRQLIHDNPDFSPNQNIIGGHFTSGSATYGSDFPQHANHIHLAVQDPAAMGGDASGMGYGSGRGASHMRALEHQIQTTQNQIENSQHDIEIAKQHIEDLKTHKKPAPPAETERANETLRRAEESHSQAESRLQDLQGQLQQAQMSGGGAGAGRGGGGGGASGLGGQDLGKTFVDGILQSFGMDGSVFSDPRQWAGVKSIMALVNWFTQPAGNSLAGNMSRGGMGPNGMPGLPGLRKGASGTDSIVDTIVNQGLAHGASGSMMESAVMAGLAESNLSPGASNSGHFGVFQMDAAKGSEADRRNPDFAANWWFSQAMGIPGAAGMSPSELAQAVEHSDKPGQYGPKQSQAQQLLQDALKRRGGHTDTPGSPADNYGGGSFGAADSGYDPTAGAGGGGGGGDGGGGLLGGLLNMIFAQPGSANNPKGLTPFGNLGVGAPNGGNPEYNSPGIYNQPGLPSVSSVAPEPTAAAPEPNVADGPAADGPAADDGSAFEADTAGYIRPDPTAGMPNNQSGGMAPGTMGGVGNVTFNLAKGATLGWDPKKTTEHMQRTANMQTNRYQNRAITL